MKAWVFILSFLCMVSRHSCLEGWYMIKSPLESAMPSMTPTKLGAIDTIYLLSYSIGLYISGVLEDSHSMKLVICSGMILASLVYYVLIAASYFSVASVPLVFVCWGLQGILQSTVWPGTVSLIANWFPKSSHGGWMGVWSCNSGTGNIVGSQIGLFVYKYTGSWELVMLTVSSFMLITAVITFLTIKDRPDHFDSKRVKGSIGFWKAWRLPGVLQYSIAYGCIKLLAYSLMMWLPYYLQNYVKTDLVHIGAVVMCFEIGGIFGSIFAGYLSDYTKNRDPVVIGLMVLAIPVIYCFVFGNSENFWVYYMLAPLAGAFVMACANLVTTCVATDLASDTENHEHTHAMATVTGIIDGTGSLGAGCGQVLIGWLSEYSWDYVFFFMISIGVLAIFIMSLARLECKTRSELEKNLIN